MHKAMDGSRMLATALCILLGTLLSRQKALMLARAFVIALSIQSPARSRLTFSCGTPAQSHCSFRLSP
jgi:hypothetical protein